CKGERMKIASLFKPGDAIALMPDALAALEKAGQSRRDFLKSAGVLIVGFSMAKPGKLAAQSATGLVDATQVDSWIAIAQDESVTAYSGKCDYGHGFEAVP